MVRGWSLAGGRNRGRGGEENLHEPACRLGAAAPRACWGGAEVVHHQVVQPSWPGEAHQLGAVLKAPPPAPYETPPIALPPELAMLRPEH